MKTTEPSPATDQHDGPTCGLKTQLTSPKVGMKLLTWVLIATAFIMIDIAILLYVMKPWSDDKEIIRLPSVPIAVEREIKK